MQGDLNQFEIDVLRAMNGETVPGLVGGAAMWTAARYLKGLGYATGFYRITEKGQKFLADRSPSPTEGDGNG